MAYPVDQYSTVVGDTFLTRAYANLSGIDCVFYVSTTNTLYVKSSNNINIFALVAGVRWMCVVQAVGVVHLYYSTLNGAIYYSPFTTQNFVNPLVSTATGLNSVVTFSACRAPNSTPACYAMIVDDGTRHTVFTSSTPNFNNVIASAQVYNNNVDRTHLVNNPVIAVHPQDTNAATINCEQTTLPNGPSKVGFYCVTLPGVA